MNLKEFEFSGFKLYERTITIMDYSTKKETINKYNIISQYKNGVPVSCWTQEVLKDTNTDLEWDRWKKDSIPILGSNDVFIKNLTEEEVFGILL